MKLSTRARYGLRALIDLGLYSETDAVSIQSIAGRQNISVSYLEQLMGKLKRAGLDYWHLLDITLYDSLSDFFKSYREQY